jgi:uncharacterized protein (DUF983 family)
MMLGIGMTKTSDLCPKCKHAAICHKIVKGVQVCKYCDCRIGDEE